MRNFLLLLIFSSLFLVSCRRETDEMPPEVEWISPSEGQQYNVFDSIHVYFRLSDDMVLENVKVKLVNEQLTPVLPAVSQSLAGKHAEIGFEYPIDNIHITSGLYYLMVEATDGNNYRRAYRALNITEAPLTLRGFFAATLPMSATLNVYKTDLSWTPGLFGQYSSDFTDLAVSNYWQHVYVNGSYFGMLRALSIDGVTPGWSKTPVASSTPYWGPMSVSGAKLWMSYRSIGEVHSLNEAGTSTFHVQADNGFYPIHQLEAGSRLFIEEHDIASGARRMVVFSTSGGAIQETPMNVDAVAIFEKDADNLYVAGNDAGQGHLLIYDAASNGFWEPISLPAGLVTSAAKIDTNTVLIGMDNGNLYRFTYNPVGLLTWASGINATQLRYDPADDFIFTAEGSDVKVYSYNPFTLQHTVPFANPVQDIELWFNR